MKKICGIDEAGRGALAGPLVASAVILNSSAQKIARLAKTKLKDSKLLTAKQRKKIFSVLKKLKTETALEIISSRQINNRGINWTNREVIRRLIKRIDADEYIVDGKIKIGRIAGKTHKIRSVVDADATIPPVIAAGIVAKVYRDKLMQKLHKQFPVYRWGINKGYGTSLHLLAIEAHGMTYYHRSVFVTTALNSHLASKNATLQD